MLLVKFLNAIFTPDKIEEMKLERSGMLFSAFNVFS
jgi:hypothetical protein